MIYIVCSLQDHLTSLDEQRKIAQCLLHDSLMQEYCIDIQPDDIIENAWGKGFLRNHRDVFFNISHCSGGIALSISSLRTGVDIERARPFSLAAARKVLAEDEMSQVLNADNPEQEFFKFWTLKESYTKAVGTGLSYPLNKIHFTIDQNSDIECNMKGCMFSLYENDLKFITAVCHLGRVDRLKEKVNYHLLP